jgi:hypothetical protein
MNDHQLPSTPDRSALAAARSAYRMQEPPANLEATLLARFGEQRAIERQAAAVTPLVAKPSRWGWQSVLSFTRLHPAFASGLSLCALLAFAAPWWLHWMSATPESTTPFMLVSVPSGGQLNVAQMVRVSVVREAMLDFGIPVPPQKLQEPVRAEMLLGPRGEMLAVRFIESPAKKRWSFD